MARASGVVEGVGRRFDSVGRRMERIGGTMTRHMTVPILLVGAAATHMALDFQQQMTLIQTQAGGTAKDVKVLSAAVLDLAKSTTQGPEELAKALYHLKSLGLDNATAMRVLKQSARGAMTGIADLEETTNALGGAVRVGIKGTEDYSKAMGTLNAIVGAGNMRMQDLVDAMGTGILPTAKLAGLSLRDVGAALTIFTDENMNSRMAMTRFRTALMMMVSPSNKAEAALESFGESGSRIGMELRTRGLPATIKDIHDHLKQLGGSGVIDELAGKLAKGKLSFEQFQKAAAKTAQFQAISKAFGGSKTASTVMLLVNQFGLLQQKYDQIGRSSNKFNASVAAAWKNSKNKILNAKSQIEVALISLGAALTPVAVQLAHAIAVVAQAFEHLSPGMRTAIVVTLGVLAVLGPLIGVIGALITVVGGLISVFAFLISPIGLVLLALAALAVGIYMLITHWNQVKAATVAAWNAVKNAVLSAVNAVKNVIVAGFRAVLSAVRSAWNAIRGATSAALSAIRGTVASGLSAVKSAFTAGWNAAKSATTTAWHAIKSAVTKGVSSVLTLIKSLPGKIVAALGDLSHLLFSAGASLITGFISGIKSKIGEVASTLGGITHKLTSWKGPPSTDKVILFKSGQYVMDGFVSGIKSREGAVKNELHKVTTTLGQSFEGWARVYGHRAGAAFANSMAKGAASVKLPLGPQIAYVQGQLTGDVPAQIAALQKEAIYLSNLAANTNPHSQKYLDIITQLQEVNSEIQSLTDQMNQASDAGDTATSTFDDASTMFDSTAETASTAFSTISTGATDAQAAVTSAMTAIIAALKDVTTAFDDAAAAAQKAWTAMSGPTSGPGPTSSTLGGGSGGGSGGNGVADVYLDGQKVGQVIRRSLILTQRRNNSPALGTTG